MNYKLKYGEFTIPFTKKTHKFEITAEYAESIRNLARNISFVICALMMFFIVVDHDKEEWTSTFAYTSAFSEFFMRSAAALQMICTLWYIAIWIMLRQPLAIKKFDNEGGEESKKIAD